MRKLSRKQKNALRKYVHQKYGTMGSIDAKPMFFNCESDLNGEAYFHVSSMNEFENFDTEVERFVNDIRTVEDCKII
jgi:hypothetical protein